ncbi:2Fe-2S iron-sulfur cluster binding domain-containing protein [bacterium]|nr:2Fe-2S iron-sulfur cluster binding domain-containing protein [bacterium]
MKHKIDFVTSNETFELEEGTYILEGLQKLGMGLPFDCGSGYCGSCLALVQGSVEWASETHCLTQDEIDQGYILPCICKMKEPLKVLD